MGLYIKLNAHPLAIDNNCVKYDLYLTRGLEVMTRTLCDQTERLTDWQTAHSIGPKNKNLVEDFEILLPVKFHWIPLSGFKGEVEMSHPIRGRVVNLGSPMGPKNYPTNLVEDLISCLVDQWVPEGTCSQVSTVYLGRFVAFESIKIICVKID